MVRCIAKGQLQPAGSRFRHPLPAHQALGADHLNAIWHLGLPEVRVKKQFNGIAALGMGIFKYRNPMPPRRPLVPPVGTQAEPGAKKTLLCVCGGFLFMIIFPGFTQVAQLRNRGDWGVFMGDKHSLTCPKTATSTPGGSPKLPRAGGTITENEGPRLALPEVGCSHSQRPS